jgi:hypothetical protein
MNRGGTEIVAKLAPFLVSSVSVLAAVFIQPDILLVFSTSEFPSKLLRVFFSARVIQAMCFEKSYGPERFLFPPL